MNNMMRNSIKRAQSQACLSFAERKNFRLQAKHKIFLTLALLLTAVTGAWADETPLVTILASENSNFTNGSKDFGGKVNLFMQELEYQADKGWCRDGSSMIMRITPLDGVTIGKVKFYFSDGNTYEDTQPDFDILVGDAIKDESFNTLSTGGVTKIEVFAPEPPPSP